MTGPDVPKESAIVQFVYDDGLIGRVVVFEQLPEVPPDQYDAANEGIVANNTGSALVEIVVIRGGQKALVASSPNGLSSGIYWLEHGVEFWVGGPRLTRDDVLEVAASV